MRSPAWLPALLALAAAGPAHGEPDRLELRVVQLEAPPAPAPEAWRRLRPDVLLLHGVSGDPAPWRAALAAAGLEHATEGAGHVLAARLPLERLGVEARVLRARLRTPLGPVLLAAVAPSGDGRRADLPRELARALDAADAVGAFGADPPPDPADPARPPLVLGGGPAGGLPLRLLVARAGLTVVPGEAEAPVPVLYRSGGAVGVRLRRAGAAGASGGREVVLELRRAPGAAVATARAAWRATAAEGLAVVEAERDRSRARAARARRLALAYLGAAALTFALGRRRRGRRGSCLLGILTLLALHLGTWKVYRGGVLEPTLERELEAAAARLEE